jgi:beta-N-acetylhexosaminidase
MTLTLPLAVSCGQLIVGGFAGPTLSTTFREALARGERGGAILFRRNLTGSLGDATALTHAIAEASPAHLPPLIGVDQEGGRVTRLRSPVLRLPTMRALGTLRDESLVRRTAEILGAQLAALGFTMNFAPVLDVDTCTTNPIIGDRSFGSEPSWVARLGAAFASGLQLGGVMACGKHFPGHGDTSVDSHLALPHVSQPRARLDTVELVPFRAMRPHACAALMTAHVVYDALDPDAPATLSRKVIHDLLRGELGWGGLIVSDDLEMKAIADRAPIEEAAVRAVEAGCDVLLVCENEELQARAHAALVRAAEGDSTLRGQIEASAARVLGARNKVPPRPVVGDPRFDLAFGPQAQALAEELEERGVLR